MIVAENHPDNFVAVWWHAGVVGKIAATQPDRPPAGGVLNAAGLSDFYYAGHANHARDGDLRASFAGRRLHASHTISGIRPRGLYAAWYCATISDSIRVPFSRATIARATQASAT